VAEAVVVSGSGGGPLLDDGKNNSRTTDAPLNDAFSTDDDDERYDCRHGVLKLGNRRNRIISVWELVLLLLCS
jgi:hypothetical protein